jgi:hypothetical protein
MKSCVTCRRTLPLSEFNRKRAASDALQNVCRECNRERARRYYRANRKKHLRAIVARTARAKLIARELAGEYLLSHPCVNSGYSLARIRTEIEKCEVRCRNCHARVTYERNARDWRSALMRRREFPETR